MGWISGWSHRKTVTITGQSGAGTDYQVNLSIGDASGGDFHLENHCTSFPNDITVTDNDQTTLLNHWVEDLTVDPISLWVEVADDLGSNADVCVYYDKSGESSASNISNPFLLGDDFNDNSFDTNKWQELGTGNLNEQNQRLEIKTTSTWGKKRAATKNSFDMSSRILEYQGYIQTESVQPTECLYTTSDLATRYWGIVWWNTDNEWRLYTLQSGSYANRETIASASLQTWYKFKITDTGTQVKAAIYDMSDNLQGETSLYNYDSPSNQYLHFEQGSTNDEGYFDAIRVRKYNSPEPAFSSAGSEESAPVAGHPTMTRWHGIPGMNYTGRAGVGW